MTRKTVSLDLDVYRGLKRRQTRHETLSATLRRMLADDKDPADYLDELAANPPKVNIALLRRRQENPLRSSRPLRKRHAA
jgi:predicted CopG family antitoxin